MNQGTRRIMCAAVLALILCTGLAPADDDYQIDWYTIDGGGAVRATGDDYELSGTIGQPDAGEMSGGTTSLTGGYWFACAPGDGDCDGAVDLRDFEDFEACLDGPGAGVGVGCDRFDLTGSGDIDLADFAEFQRSFTG